MPDQTKEVALDVPIDVHGKRHAVVIVRAPRPREYFKYGEPRSYGQTAEKIVVAAENDAAVAAYVEACIVEPDPAVVLASATLADAMRIKEAILDFFAKARSI